MAIHQHATTFAGYPVIDWDDEAASLQPQHAYRIRQDHGDGDAWTDSLAALLDQPGAAELPAIVVGMWNEAYEDSGMVTSIVEALVAARDRLPALRGIFFGDITSEECEISWIQNTDVSPLFDAYPALEYFCVRGATGLSLGSLRHAKLRSLVVESGGLGATVVREVAKADLPALEHLELWLGTPDYGGDATVDDLQPILAGTHFPQLSYLGLRNSEIADLVATAVAQAPILSRIQVLDLSLGTLGDAGAQALLDSPAVAKLRKLDIHHHYCSEAQVSALQALGIDVDASDPEEADDDGDTSWRYVAVGE